MSDEFDFTKEYGQALAIVPIGKTSLVDGCTWVVACENTDASVEDAFLTGEVFIRDAYKEFIPDKYWPKVQVLSRWPDREGSPLTRTGTISWLYSPAKEAQNAEQERSL